MQPVDTSQGSKIWLINRLGKITGTRFAAAMGSRRRQVTLGLTIQKEIRAIQSGDQETIDSFINEFYSKYTEWGKKWEPSARAAYELRNDCDVIVLDFVIHPEYPFIACSPDGETDVKLLEIKCPHNQDNHKAAQLFGVPEVHIHQVKGNTIVCNKPSGSFLSFDPRQATPKDKLVVIDVEREQKYEKELIDNCCMIYEWALTGKFPNNESEKKLQLF